MATNLVTWARRQPRWRWLLVLVVVVGGVLWWRGGAGPTSNGVTFETRRGPLTIKVVEGGSIQALEYQEIKCEARVGYQGIKILKIVEEGYQVTDDDVRTNKILVELDSSDLQKQITQQEIQLQSAAATFTDAQQGYDIQLNQNTSDLKAAEQKARFARMDFEKFLGDKAALEVINELGLDQLMADAETNRVVAPALPATPDDATPGAASVPNGAAPPPVVGATVAAAEPPPENGSAPGVPLEVLAAGAVALPVGPTPGSAPPPTTAPAPAPALAVKVDFSRYARLERLSDGEAMQKLRKLQDEKKTAEKELRQAESTLKGTQRLFEKLFVTRTDLQRDEIAHDTTALKLQSAETAERLFLKYEFPKTAEETLSKYAEAVRELDRARRAAISKMAQAEAKLKSAQGQYNIQSRQLKELQEQLAKCTITAQKPGLVVYGGAGQDMVWYGDQERIREGATVRERQSIITIPDMNKMSVKVRIHESYIKKIKKGQPAQITVDAFADKLLKGEVSKVGVLPDSQNMWANPDLKVYLTTVDIAGTHDWLKPGMSAKVEILVNQLTNVVHVPVQAVVPEEGKQVCYVGRGLKPERREVEIGEASDEFVEIKSGLKEGDQVLLRARGATAPAAGEKAKEPEKEKSTATPVAPAAAPPVPNG